MDKHESAAWNHAANFKSWRAEQGSTMETCLMDLAELEIAVERVRRRIVIDAAKRNVSWVAIGEMLGMTKQGAWSKYARFVK